MTNTDLTRGALLVTLGALMPDLPMLGFYAYQRVFLGTPESVIWADAYFRPSWQLLFDLFNSIPLLALAALLAWRAGATPALAFLLSMLLHCLADLPLHNDDAHAHFLPLSDWRFRSAISYWDPRFYGRVAAGLELDSEPRLEASRSSLSLRFARALVTLELALRARASTHGLAASE